MADLIEKMLISYKEHDFIEKINAFCSRRATEKIRLSLTDSKEAQSVLKILRNVAENGDKAVSEYTNTYDGVDLLPGQFRVGIEEMKKAHKGIEGDLLKSIKQAIENVRAYQKEIFIGDGSSKGIKYVPIQKVGVCVPGAAAPLPSTVFMTVVPAQVAGVEEITVVSPPRFKGGIHPVILGVCFELGISEVYKIGGAQAVAALAFGTETIKKVHMIVGPGNVWVQMAKKFVSGNCTAIDSIAGPSEVLILANEQANPRWAAADMLSQAEHADDSWAVMVTDSEHLAIQVCEKLKKQLQDLTRREEAEKSLADFGAIIVMEDIQLAVKFANDFAAEHLQVMCGSKSGKIADLIENAGAVFVGEYTPVAVGDYWAGPSHTLPTGQAAKFASALTSNDFLKSISMIEYDKDKLTADAKHIIRLAEIEGLDAHAKSVRIRQSP